MPAAASTAQPPAPLASPVSIEARADSAGAGVSQRSASGHASTSHATSGAVHDTVATDHSGGEQTGKASWYGPGFADHEMADGRVMDPHANVVASKTLPLGSTAG